MIKRILSVLAALALIGVLSLYAFRSIDFDADPLNLLPQGLPQVSAMRAYEEAFASQNDILIVVTRPGGALDEEVTASLQGFLESRSDLFQSLTRRPPWEADPSQMGEMLAYLWLNGPTEDLREMVARLSGEGAGRELSESLDILANSMDMGEVARVSYDPFHLSALNAREGGFRMEGATRFGFVSDDGELHLMLAEPAEELAMGSEVIAWQSRVEEAVEEWRSDESGEASEIRVQFTGRKIYVTEATRALRGDLMISVLITLGFVMVVFGLVYRRFLPLLVLLAALYGTFVITLLLGELIYHELSATSVGFAAILMGLAVDYGLVIYQESWCRGRDPRELRPVFGRSIGWAALTTACVFLALNRSIMPGAVQLGTMVAIGVTVGALMMIFPYATGLAWVGCGKKRPNGETIRARGKVPWYGTGRGAGIFSAVSVVLLVAVLSSQGFPALNSDAEALKPREGVPEIALYRRVMEKLGGDRRTLTVLASGENEAEVREALERGRKTLESAERVQSLMIPTRLWPDADIQQENRPLIRELLTQKERWMAQAEAEGFEEESLVLTKRALEAWEAFADGTGLFLPGDPPSQWLMKRLTRTEPGDMLAVGFIKLKEGFFTLSPGTVLALNEAGLRPVGWEFLTPEIRNILKHDILHVVVPTAVILLLLLALVFRSIKGVSISIALLAFSALMLLAVMQMRGMDWNIVSIAAGPLLLGLGLDYSIHVILALRRTHGNVAEIHQNIGRALLLCGTTTAVGFASLRSARHGGLPILGELCAIGILITMIAAIFLVPHWWRFLHRSELHDRPMPGRSSPDPE